MSKHERLSDRFADIFIRLNNQEFLSVSALAEEYQVSEKTIRRDLVRMERYIPLMRKRGKVGLDTHRQFNLSEKEFQELIRLIGVYHLFPSMDIQFLKTLIQQKTQSVYHIKHYFVEDVEQFESIMTVLNTAISQCKKVSFSYNDTQRVVNPYKLIHKEGFWYLSGVEKKKLKTYRLSKIHDVIVKSTKFKVDEAMLTLMTQDESIWFGGNETTVTVSVPVDVASYFIQRQILPRQVIEDQPEQGGLILKSTVWHKHELFPILRCWIPHLRIIEPQAWQEDFEQELRGYLSQT